METLEKEEKNYSTYLDLIHLINHPIVLILHETDIQKCFGDVPESVKKFLNLRYKSADMHEKKVMKRFFLPEKKNEKRQAKIVNTRR